MLAKEWTLQTRNDHEADRDCRDNENLTSGSDDSLTDGIDGSRFISSSVYICVLLTELHRPKLIDQALNKDLLKRTYTRSTLGRKAIADSETFIPDTMTTGENTLRVGPSPAGYPRPPLFTVAVIAPSSSDNAITETVQRAYRTVFDTNVPC
ncbi:uncharacterized protein BT62DRAFT_1079668 [Guyanagaster necrorhizus]|uniref:Uncharacterized protein n=1 Tax=Guyanagaster necrorhizus TaxID=856835 RepID=A0A9P7VIW2_9AGAR|nr:uncharacterized protein BT62DRAFT_1079668 [Guyanagaster necrorhizus MCA 3950]KAG7441916.1 hypothetical protein BT62DRAFT_1079668 [Guyanagaster necrorhizus MCA 3950]